MIIEELKNSGEGKQESKAALQLDKKAKLSSSTNSSSSRIGQKLNNAFATYAKVVGGALGLRLATALFIDQVMS